MCGRYYLNTSPAEVAQRWGAVVQGKLPFEQNDDIRPTTSVPVVRQHERERIMLPQKWGLQPSWAKSILIHARAKEAAHKATWKRALKERRCLLPASGFFEWPKDNKSRPRAERQKFRIGFNSQDIAALAGLWFPPTTADDNEEHCVILTTEPNTKVEGIPHHRMPVVIPKDQFEHWLDETQTDSELLEPFFDPWNSDDTWIQEERNTQ